MDGIGKIGRGLVTGSAAGKKKSEAAPVGGTFKSDLKKVEEKPVPDRRRERDPDRENARAAYEQLRELESLRLNLGEDRVTEAGLNRLKDREREIEKVGNPALKDVLRAVNTRCQVEKAKYLK